MRTTGNHVTDWLLEGSINGNSGYSQTTGRHGIPMVIKTCRPAATLRSTVLYVNTYQNQWTERKNEPSFNCWKLPSDIWIATTVPKPKPLTNRLTCEQIAYGFDFQLERVHAPPTRRIDDAVRAGVRIVARRHLSERERHALFSELIGL